LAWCPYSSPARLCLLVVALEPPSLSGTVTLTQVAGLFFAHAQLPSPSPSRRSTSIWRPKTPLHQCTRAGGDSEDAGPGLFLLELGGAACVTLCGRAAAFAVATKALNLNLAAEDPAPPMHPSWARSAIAADNHVTLTLSPSWRAPPRPRRSTSIWRPKTPLHQCTRAGPAAR
jgi:hypothetical protein